jgi:tetrahydromethanopterin S-methyltransferase subunit B
LTRVKEAEQRAASAERQLRKFGSPPAPAGTYYENEATARNTSVFAVMGADLAKLSTLVAGNDKGVGVTLEQQVNRTLGDIVAAKPGVLNANDSLLTAVRKLDERLTEVTKKGDDLAKERDGLEQKVGSLTQDLAAVRKLFEDQVKELKDRIDQSEREFAEKLDEKDTQLNEIRATLDAREQQLNTLKREGDQEKRELQLTIDRQTRQIADLQKKIQDLKGSYDPEAILKKAAGRIRRAIPGSDVVYINLGAKDNIKVGMGFEVFSQTGSTERTLRGKASLEVVTLEESSSECRVARTTPGQPIMEGDIVVNIAYERGRKPKFVVRGDFDLNFDGQVDFDGPDRVASIIREWGGQAVPELDESVDFVVIGVAPRGVEVKPDASDIVRDQAERKKLELSEFRKLIDQAKSMYIPVITQNQFLFLTGYAGDALVRQR